MNSKSRLREDIRSFRRVKILYAIPMIILGALGLLLPIIPGILLLVAGTSLIFPFSRQRKSL